MILIKRLCGIFAALMMLATMIMTISASGENTSSFADVRNVETNLISTPSLITKVKTKTIYDSIMSDSPATAFFYLNKNGEVTDENGEKIATISEAVGKLESKVIAGFIPSDEAAVDKLAEFMERTGYYDVTVMSDNADLVGYATKTNMNIRGAVRFADMKANDYSAVKMRETVNISGSKIAVLPRDLVTAENVQKLQKLCVTVWVESSENEDETESVRMILSGANGIITDNRAQTEKSFTKFFDENSITRTMWIIGHRGIALAPENTIESAKLAAEKGADIIENDIFLTGDNVLVVMHDDSPARTTDGPDEYLWNLTYDELLQFNVDTKPDEYPNCKIPRLEDYFITFKDTDTNIFIEIKGYDPEIISHLKELIDKYDIANQVSTISFRETQIAYTNEQIPYVSTGYLTTAVIDSKASILENVGNIVKATQTHKSTFNRSFIGLTKDMVIQSSHRGVSFWPWTINNESDISKAFLYGVNGITTDYSNLLENSSRFITSEKYDYTMKVNEQIDLPLQIITYGDDVKEFADGNFKIISGDDVISFDGKKMTALKEGTATFFCQAPSQVGLDAINISSQLFTVTVSGVAPKPLIGAGSNSIWMYVGIIGGSVILLCGICAVIIIVSKRKKAA